MDRQPRAVDCTSRLAHRCPDIKGFMLVFKEALSEDKVPALTDGFDRVGRGCGENMKDIFL